tara:strand:- start:2198 stop:2899 length:702 start_codon:yes stop_codon:yes gene_type:complete
MKKIIIIPTYNEKKNITKLINKIFKLYKSDFDVLVVDDNSPDKTLNEVIKLKKKYKFLKYLKRNKKLGIGSAHKDAILNSYKKKYDLIITMDSDGTHDPIYIKKMTNKIKKYDLIITNRFKKKNSLSEWPIHRIFLTKLRFYLISFLLNIPLDTSGAYRCYNTKKINIKDILIAKDNGYSFFWESGYVLFKKKYKIFEIPIKLPYRTVGSSKMKISDIIRALYYLSIVAIKRL